MVYASNQLNFKSKISFHFWLTNPNRNLTICEDGIPICITVCDLRGMHHVHVARTGGGALEPMPARPFRVSPLVTFGEIVFYFFTKNGSWRGQGPTRPTCTSARPTRPTDYTRKWKIPSGGAHNAWNQGRSERHIFVWPGYGRCVRIVCSRWK